MGFPQKGARVAVTTRPAVTMISRVWRSDSAKHSHYRVWTSFFRRNQNCQTSKSWNYVRIIVDLLWGMPWTTLRLTFLNLWTTRPQTLICLTCKLRIKSMTSYSVVFLHRISNKSININYWMNLIHLTSSKKIEKNKSDIVQLFRIHNSIRIVSL